MSQRVPAVSENGKENNKIDMLFNLAISQVLVLYRPQMEKKISF